MSTTPHHDADRETLSALFDGELDGDAARFAVKRLDHDPQWRDACGRWQLAGDALRGHATAVAPTGFADRVSVALADEGAAAMSTIGATAARAATPMRRSWIGGAALAASVALAALFVTRPFSPEVIPTSRVPQVVTGAQPAASVTDAASTIAAAAPAAPLQDAPLPALPAAETGLAAATLAVADVSRRAGERRSRERGQGTAPDSVPPRETSAVTSATVIASVADAATPTPTIESATPHPFLPPGEIVARPWPRAALPDYPTGNAFNVSFDSRAGYAGVQGASPGASSFYPFEPRMLEAEPLADPAADERVPDARDWPQR
ncbi:MAG: RseA family anti-sigma factor [Lysobacter sp.]